ncbi:hypothetical protein BABINDRAFT_47805 [Babjeviella inositovora NRRL Y-12698]|uniref:Mitochondrial import inner membrane translocase subunit n=1 Tax=Babjeviella inositovora NRRL Y-12698 TaxID=984486 RepID=A0A1E3QUP1_9ASCO|nr:uncharacterized protein BABINDRAFT_47805 [Babjeviella inositovora NRRL Y-12698]ODQ80667.1 hypothetical protein BABINDRAFT_47805 [Babjeviella inositovora NRRL Y-12698]
MALFGSAAPQQNAVQASQARQQIQDQIAQELAVANASELVNKLTDNCFASCIANPGPSFSAQEDTCVNQCLEKYMRSWNVISRTYVARIQKASSSGELN